MHDLLTTDWDVFMYSFQFANILYVLGIVIGDVKVTFVLFKDLIKHIKASN